MTIAPDLSPVARNRLFAKPLLAVAALLVGFASMGASSHAADPYDKNLEARVEALERELNILSNDSKGKNVETSTEVPSFLRAAGKQVKELTISGDLRFRYNYDNEDFQYPGAGNELQRSRYLVRLRLNLNYTFTDNWFAGLGVATNGASDTSHATITEGFDDYGIYLHQFFLGWKINDYATVLLGKIYAPFYDNIDAPVDWGDITPVGFTEKFNFPITPLLSVAANFGQYLFYENPESGYLATTRPVGNGLSETVYTTNPATTIPDSRKEDAWLFYQDIVVTYKPTNDITATVAPAFYFYAPHGSVGVSGNAVGQGGRSNPNDVNTANPLAPSQGGLLNVAAFNSDDATRSLYVGLFDGDVKFPIGPIKGKFYWDFAYNFRGSERAHQVYGVQEGSFRDSTVWLAGFQLGELKRKGDWYFSLDYRQYGIASTDPNLNDPLFAESRLNTQGFRANLGYNLTDWLKAEVWYYGAWNLDKNIHSLSGVDLTNGTIRAFYDANAVQNLVVQLTASF